MQHNIYIYARTIQQQWQQKDAPSETYNQTHANLWAAVTAAVTTQVARLLCVYAASTNTQWLTANKQPCGAGK